jgi:drug/metabolite transporter (DMT)-like permease
MSSELLGVVLGLCASVSFESGYLLMTQQSRLVGRSGRPGGRFLLSLVRRPLWLAAIALDGAGIVLELFALREASLIIVQPLMSVWLIGLVFAAAIFLGERIDRRTVLAAGAVAVGVVCVIIAAPSDAGAVRLAHPVASVLALGALALVVVAAFVGPAKAAGWGPVAAAAAGDTLVAISGNQIARSWVERPLLAIAWTAAVVASGVASVTAESAALQRLPASRVGPIVSSVGAVLPVVLMALLSPQRVSLSPGAAALLGVGLALTGGGAYRLAATARGGPLADDDQAVTSAA